MPAKSSKKKKLNFCVVRQLNHSVHDCGSVFKEESVKSSEN